MPTYERRCPDCDHAFEVVLPMRCSSDPVHCPKCGAISEREFRTAPAGRMDPAEWSSENGGKGRYITQLQQTLGNKVDKGAFCRNRQEARDKAHKRGLVTEIVG